MPQIILKQKELQMSSDAQKSPTIADKAPKAKHAGGRPKGSTKANTKAKKQTILWQPQPKQVEALERPEYEILYGGARGGGKTAAGIGWLLYPFTDFRQ